MRQSSLAIRELETSFVVIRSNRQLADFETGSSLDNIYRAEKMLGLIFPKSYVKFLLELGAGDFNGREFYGIVNGSLPGTSAPSAVWFTLDEREKAGLPIEFVVVGSTGYGSLFCLDTSRCEEGEAVVVEWDKFTRTDVACSFGTFFSDEIKASLEATG